MALDGPVNWGATKTTSNGAQLGIEYRLACGHSKIRMTSPPAPVGTVSFCWSCQTSRVVMSRDVVRPEPKTKRAKSSEAR